MADLKISQLTSATVPLTGAEQVPLVQSGTTKKTTVADLTKNPAFGAYATATTSLPQNVWTKIALGGEDFDTNSCFDTTNSRFTPNVAGYYLFTAGYSSFGASYASAAIAKNGTAVSRGSSGYSNSSFTPYSYTVTFMVYLNGTTDYVELFAIQGNGTQTATDGFLQGMFIRS